MKREKIAFVDIDTQIDFMDKSGALYVESSEEIKGNLKKLTDYAVKNGIIIFASVDAHSEKDPEFLNFPPHCIKGKRGYEKIDETRAEKFISVPYDREISFEIKDYNQIIFEKRTFSIFDNPNFIKILKKLGKEIFFVYGVTTEYCVKEAADGLIGENYRVYLIFDAIKAIDKEKGEKVIEELKLKGVKLIKTEEVFKIIEKEG